jgi:hypothetical protein
LSSLPSKGVREKAIDAFNVWFQVPADKLERIKLVTNILHGASLMSGVNSVPAVSVLTNTDC